MEFDRSRIPSLRNICSINSWLINRGIIMGTLDLNVVVGLYVLIFPCLFLIGLGINHYWCICSYLWLHLVMDPPRRNSKKTIYALH